MITLGAETKQNEEIPIRNAKEEIGSDGGMIDRNNCFRLTDREREILKRALDSVPYDDAGRCEYIRAMRAAAVQAIPRRITSVLESQRTSLNPRPYIILDNLPTDDEVFGSPQAHEQGSAYKSANISENLAISVASLIGEPYSVNFEGSDIVNNLTPERGKEKEYTGLGSGVELDFHIENAALKFHSHFNMTPTGLLLTGVREDPRMPKTRFADARLAVDLLTPADLEILRGNNFRIRVPYRWREAFSANGSIHYCNIGTIGARRNTGPTGDRRKALAHPNGGCAYCRS